MFIVFRYVRKFQCFNDRGCQPLPGTDFGLLLQGKLLSLLKEEREVIEKSYIIHRN